MESAGLLGSIAGIAEMTREAITTQVTSRAADGASGCRNGAECACRPAVRREPKEAAMDAITTFLNEQPAWHWWALGAILLAVEITSTTQYLLWPGLAALLVGVLKFVDPSLDGRLAVFLFAVISVVATAAWKRSAWGRADRDTHATLNDRSAQYVGRVVKAERISSTVAAPYGSTTRAGTRRSPTAPRP